MFTFHALFLGFSILLTRTVQRYKISCNAIFIQGSALNCRHYLATKMRVRRRSRHNIIEGAFLNVDSKQVHKVMALLGKPTTIQVVKKLQVFYIIGISLPLSQKLLHWSSIRTFSPCTLCTHSTKKNPLQKWPCLSDCLLFRRNRKIEKSNY